MKSGASISLMADAYSNCIERSQIMLPRTTSMLIMMASLLQGGCSQQPGSCHYQVESISLGGAMLDKQAGEGETVDKDDALWVCKSGHLVKVNN
jgi:hypothetical protein